MNCLLNSLLLMTLLVNISRFDALQWLRLTTVGKITFVCYFYIEIYIFMSFLLHSLLLMTLLDRISTIVSLKFILVMPFPLRTTQTTKKKLYIYKVQIKKRYTFPIKAPSHTSMFWTNVHNACQTPMCQDMSRHMSTYI